MKVVVKYAKESEKEQHTQVGRRLLSEILFQEFSIELTDLSREVTILPGGKPILTAYPQVHFNISHSKEMVVCVVSQVCVGVDVEFQQNRIPSQRLIERIMGEKEREEYAESGQSLSYFYKCWTQRESYLKYTGEGISKLTKNLDDSKCQFHFLDKIPGYTLCICLPGEIKDAIIKVIE